jgi:hypothetical protein
VALDAIAASEVQDPTVPFVARRGIGPFPTRAPASGRPRARSRSLVTMACACDARIRATQDLGRRP